MPAPAALCRLESGGRCAVTFAGRVLFCYDADDIGMRNMAVVAVTDAGMGGKETAAAFGLTPEYVSMLRGRARRQGSSGLVKRRGRPPKLTSRQVGKARVWAAEGVSQTGTRPASGRVPASDPRRAGAAGPGLAAAGAGRARRDRGEG